MNENNGRGQLAIGNPTLFTLARFTGYQPKSDRRRRPRKGVPFVVVRRVGRTSGVSDSRPLSSQQPAASNAE